MYLMKSLLLICLSALNFSLLIAQQENQHIQQLRNVEPIIIRNQKNEPEDLYKNSHALVVGVSQYTNGWDVLLNPVKDAGEVSTELEKHGFTVNLILNPTSDSLRRAIDNFIAGKGLDSQNRLLFYFAGHGHSLAKAYGDTMGYIIPADAPLPDKDKVGFIRKAIDMQQFDTYARRIEAKHALFVFDCCFSGSIFQTRSEVTPRAVSYDASQPVRQFITAGRANETVPDQSLFKNEFIAALKGNGDLNDDGYISGWELGFYLKDKVAEYSDGYQHPRIGAIRDQNLDKGDFVFKSPLGGNVNNYEEETVKKIPNVELPDVQYLKLPKPVFRFMGMPINNEPVYEMIREKKFYCSGLNNQGFNNKFEQQGEVIVDYESGLFWQRSGSTNKLTLEQAGEYIDFLNNSLFAGFSGWRLPTLEEAFSLVEPNRNHHGIYIDDIFDPAQEIIITSDYSADANNKFQWVVWYKLAAPGGIRKEDTAFVRAVR